MKRPVIRSVLIGAALVSSSVAGILAAAAGAPVDHVLDSHVAGQSMATTEAEQAQVESYWTGERMSSAVPADVRRGGDTAPGSGAGRPGRDMSGSEPESAQSRLGKVFFTLGGVDYVCSGTATTSVNRDVVTTAGHCVHDGDGGSFATNFTFVPAYESGSAPYGQWSARALYTSRQWAESGTFDYDVGFAVLNEDSSGRSLTDVVGSYPVAFDLARGLDYTSYGYPAAPPFDGASLYSCTGTAHDDPYGATTQGLACDMTGGSSGGGWITDGQLNSVNSYKYTSDPNTMYGPYFGETVRAVYESAAGS